MVAVVTVVFRSVWAAARALEVLCPSAGFALTGGGDGNTVTVNNAGLILTHGDRSNGIEAQSIGGAGGNGGFSLSGSLSLDNAGLSASIGGTGSGGGSGGTVTVNSNIGGTLTSNIATIETTGQSANGIEAQSIGGGGGSGGFSGAFTATANAKASLSLSVGGFGAPGNSAGSVNVASLDNILTQADGSNGILAQSIGGGGGEGGFSFAGTVSVPTGNSFSLAASLGGFGGSGGDAGKVTVASTGIISTKGNNADGVVAQSIGGGGGNGGLSLAGTFNFASDNNVPSITASVGGSGGAGGAGKDVSVMRIGDTVTVGDKSVGIFAQSVGGGGGNGGMSLTGAFGGPDAKQISASVGGFGGPGSGAGVVTVNNTGNITTGSSSIQDQQIAQVGTVFQQVTVLTGQDAHGILAQSIGGGGGNGGFSFSGSVGITGENLGINVGLTVGGSGGSGGVGNNVNVTNNGLIHTIGSAANGIEAQSIGGGGGNGGSSITGLISAGDPTTGKALNVAVSVGGTGGDGNTAGDVHVDQSGGIFTQGSGSNGIFAQSVGGGGGTGGGANSLSLQLASSCTASIIGKIISVTGCASAKNPSINAQVDVGGSGGTGGDAGNVTVNNHGFITTTGNVASGIFAQSIGGGGGNGGQGIVGLDGAFPNASYVDKALGVVTFFTGTTGSGLKSIGQITVGGKGGASGNGKAVDVTNSGVIQTSGTDSYGIFAQSVGGGGGVGGDSKSSGDGLTSIGGFGGASGNGGAVTVTNSSSATIVSTGYGSTAIFAQSVGGGGGSGGSSGGLLSLGGYGGASGSGGSVNVSNDGILQTQGDSAMGILAQSVGGGGGNGGKTSSSKITLGGSGGASGDGGAVTVTNSKTASISTFGAWSNGIEAQSVGGGGGTGGAAGAILALGGFGGASGNGGSVTVTNDAILVTRGISANGIIAQSVGGGGGNGGTSDTSGVTLGGFGGTSGNGGTVTVTNSKGADIMTFGAGATGIFAQSVGGGGGNGGGTGLGGITIGGVASGGGTGGQVTIDNQGSVITAGDNAFGLFGQSVGGSGGNGGATFISAVAVGGSGGSSGTGGEVNITNSGLINTTGNGSDAIRAQSVGGGGGSAGGVSDSGSIGLGLLVSVGGSGSGGGTGGRVVVENSNILLTSGNESNGIFAQSVGGGGGYGGREIGAIAIGGSTGVKGDGGEVSVTNQAGGTIWTKGTMSNGIFAQSVGGGGGTAGTDYTGAPVGFFTLVGGNGTGGGNGGGVTVKNYGQIETDGVASQAILAQSIGGGGGNGVVAGSFDSTGQSGTVTVSVGGNGGTGGNGGAVTVNNYATGSIFTNGANSTAIFAQSVGGGGGNGGGFLTGTASGGTATLTLGGNGGDGGSGGGVMVANNGVIQINAKNSVGIMAQSVGGGGGTAGSALGGSVVPVSIGGQNGAAGAGGNVSVTNTGSIIIAGSNSIGLFAQSVGGGGGLVQPGGGAGSVTLLSGGIGNGGTVTIDNTAGSIVVTGENSIALYSQSVGGGGGAVGLSADPPGQIGAFMFSGTAGGQGTAQAIVVNQTGNLIATGGNSIALTAQSTAAAGNGDITVNIMNAGTTLSLIKGGSSQGAGVSILNGANNQLNNNGYITNVSGADGFAVRSTTGNDHINNYGTVLGSVDLGAGANSFYNRPNAVFSPGVTVNLGAGNILTNEGLFSPGGYQHIMTTSLTGIFTQSASGIYGVDLNPNGNIADRVNISETAGLSGTVAVNLTNPKNSPGYALPGSHEYVLLSAAGGLTTNGITLLTPPSAILTYSLFQPNATDLYLKYDVNYTPAGLTVNQRSVGSAITRIELAQQSPAFSPIASALFYVPNVAALGRTYDSLSGEGISAAQQTGFWANDKFLTSVAHRLDYWISNDSTDLGGLAFSGDKDLIYAQRMPKDSVPDADGLPRELPRNWRVWMTGYGGGSSYDGDPVTIGSARVDIHGGGFTMGIDDQISPNFLVGIGGGSGFFSTSVSDRQTSLDIDAWHIAGYGAFRQEHFYATGALAYDHFANDEKRYALIPGTGEYLKGKFQSYSVSGNFELGYKNQIGSLEVTPFAGVQFGSMRINGFTESEQGAGTNLGLSYAGQNVSSLPTVAGVQLKTKKKLANGMVLSASARAAWMHEFEPERTTRSSFITAPRTDFTILGAQPAADSARTGAAVNLSVSKNCSLFVNFDSDYSEKGNSYSGMGGLRISW